MEAAGSKLKRVRYSSSEKITWREPMRGTIPLTDKEIADQQAIGGLRNAADSVGRLHLVAAFGINPGKQLRELMTANTKLNDDKGTPAASWVNVTCESVGTSDSSCKPPPDAVEAVRRLLIEATGMTGADANTPRLTNVDAYLLDAWRIAARDPEVYVGAWLKDGAPAGITMPIHDPGIFPA